MEIERRGSSYFSQGFNLSLEEEPKTRIWNIFRLPSLMMTEDHEDSFGHSQFVTSYTLLLAKALGYENERFLRDIERGALVHDIGKIGIPEAILRKKGPLTFPEREMIKEHPCLGYEMIKEFNFLKKASLVVLYHHERYDGTGYPFGLCRESIPIEARIFSLADTIDAITSDRPYREGKGFQEALEEIKRGSGSQFDPFLVDIALEILRKYWERIREETMVKFGRLAFHLPKSTFFY